MDRGFVRALDGTRIHWTSWGLEALPAEGAVAVVVHGYGEHLGRYDHVARRLVERGLGVVALDLRGHGQSEGQRGHVDRFDDYQVDLASVFDLVGRRHPGGRRVLIGHSNGGLVAARYALGESGVRPDALILSSPLLGLAMEVPAWKVALGKAASRLAPRTSLANDVDASLLTHDREIAEAYERDPLVHHVATAGYFSEMKLAVEDTFERAHALMLPTLVLCGGSDQIADPGGARRLAHSVGTDACTFLCYEGLYHELFNELERERVLDDVVDWLENQGLQASEGESR